MLCCTKWDHHTKILIKNLEKKKCYKKVRKIFKMSVDVIFVNI